MRYAPINPELFVSNRQRLAKLLLPNSLAVVNANDLPPTNADGTSAMPPNSDLFYLTGVEQEQTILLLYPDADDEKHRELLFLREPTPGLELWEGHKLTRDEARRIACAITETGFRRALKFVKPGVNEREVEAEFIHEFTRRHARFAYLPIIATGPNALALHYIDNSSPCKAGELLLLDVAARFANY